MLTVIVNSLCQHCEHAWRTIFKNIELSFINSWKDRADVFEIINQFNLLDIIIGLPLLTLTDYWRQEVGLSSGANNFVYSIYFMA